MKLRIRIITLSAVAAAMFQHLDAQNVPPAFTRDDKNGDGRVSKEEFSGQVQGFKRLDRNGDGFIDKEEVSRVRAGRQPQGRARNQATPRIPEAVLFEPDAVYGKGGESELKLDIVRPKAASDAPRPMLVFIHGGAFRAGDKRGAVRNLIPFAERGYVCATINYRLSGEAIFPAQIEDCKCAIRYLRAHAKKYGIDPQKVGIWGSSAGGHLVTLLGTSGDISEFEGQGGWAEQSSRVQAVCDWYGPSNFVTMATQESRMDHNGPDSPEGQLLGGTVLENKDKALHASPITYATPDDPPFLIMHGTKDPTVPFAQSVELTEELKRQGVKVEFIPIEGAGHGGREFRTPEMTQKVNDFFDTALGVTPESEK